MRPLTRPIAAAPSNLLTTRKITSPRCPSSRASTWNSPTPSKPTTSPSHSTSLSSTLLQQTSATKSSSPNFSRNSKRKCVTPPKISNSKRPPSYATASPALSSATSPAYFPKTYNPLKPRPENHWEQAV